MNDETNYVFPIYSKNKINNAGKEIAKTTNINYDSKSIEYINNWRLSHAYPLDKIYELLKQIDELPRDTLFAKRQKRLESLISKLQRLKDSELCQMQDLGGCRLILPDMDSLIKSIDKVKKHLTLHGHEIVRTYDYINKPRIDSGYRSYHIVVKYKEENSPFNNMFIEIQMRTKLQHAWATAVEIIDATLLFNKLSDSKQFYDNRYNPTIKSGDGDKKYVRFFKLVSALFALREKTTLVEGVPDKNKAITAELKKIDKENRIIERIAGCNNVIKFTKDHPKDGDYYLFIMNKRQKSIAIKTFFSYQLTEAENEYIKLEKNSRKDNLDVVLVSTSNINDIRECYPNYFWDTNSFLREINELSFIIDKKTDISLNINDLGEKLTKIFNVKLVKSNIPQNTNLDWDGIGEIQGEQIICPNWGVTLNNSYLRFSGIMWKANTTPGTKLEADTIQNPAVIVLSTGASFLVNKDEWSYYSFVDSLLIEPKNKTGINQLYLLIAWLKSNICTWNIVRNKNKNNILDENLYECIKIPQPSKPQLKQIIEHTKNILKKENAFLIKYHNPNINNNERNELIYSFNDSVLPILQEIDKVFANYFSINIENFKKIIKDLNYFGYFTYSK